MTAMSFPRLLLIAAVVPVAASADGIAPPALGAAAPSLAISRGFAGAYAGGSVGAGRLDADDVFERLGDVAGIAFGAVEAAAGRSDGPDTGAAYGLHTGFNVQRGRFVFGPELAVFGAEAEVTGDVFGTFPAVVNPNEVSATLDRGARLVARGGVVAGATLVYGTAGLAYLEGEAPVLGRVDGLSASLGGEEFGEWGYALGFGVERLVGPRLMIGAQYTLHRVGEVGGPRRRPQPPRARGSSVGEVLIRRLRSTSNGPSTLHPRAIFDQDTMRSRGRPTAKLRVRIHNADGHLYVVLGRSAA